MGCFESKTKATKNHTTLLEFRKRTKCFKKKMQNDWRKWLNTIIPNGYWSGLQYIFYFVQFHLKLIHIPLSCMQQLDILWCHKEFRIWIIIYIFKVTWCNSRNMWYFHLEEVHYLICWSNWCELIEHLIWRNFIIKYM
jgi:hypothetical protein